MTRFREKPIFPALKWEANRSRKQFESFAPLGPAASGAFFFGHDAREHHGLSGLTRAPVVCVWPARTWAAGDASVTGVPALPRVAGCLVLLLLGCFGDERETTEGVSNSGREVRLGTAPADVLLEALGPARGNVLEAL